MDFDTLDQKLYDLGEGYEAQTLSSTKIAAYLKGLEKRIAALEADKSKCTIIGVDNGRHKQPTPDPPTQRR